jgi:hypothetical protein
MKKNSQVVAWVLALFNHYLPYDQFDGFLLCCGTAKQINESDGQNILLIFAQDTITNKHFQWPLVQDGQAKT